jgi:diguanylate cyclase (GGDEF)-like protein
VGIVDAKRRQSAASPRVAGLGPNALDVVVVTSGACSFLFILIAGMTLYGNTRRLDELKDWVQRTQKIMLTLQQTEHLADRVELGERLYGLTNDRADWKGANDSAAELAAVPLSLEPLIADAQARAINLTQMAESHDVARDVRELTAGGEPDRTGSLARFRLTMVLMKDRELSLLSERNTRLQQALASSLRTERVLIGLSLLSVLALFGFLVRDMRLRKRSALEIVLANAELTASVLVLEDTVFQSRLLMACGDELQLCLAVEQIYETAAGYLARLMPGTSGSLCMINNSRNLMEVVSYWGATALAKGEAFEHTTCCGLRLGQMRWRRLGVSEIECTHFPGKAPARYLCLPLGAQGDTLGVLSVECADDQAFLTVERRMRNMVHLLQLTSVTVAALKLRTKLETQAMRDALTGVYNRHFMQVTLEREISRASRFEGTMAVFMLDVDHFKKFNDTYGHPAGDAMLKGVARVLQLNVRTEDTVCRYGGEEFAVILPGISAEKAQARAELIRMAVSRLRVPLGNGAVGEVTVSVGCSMYTPGVEDGEALIANADRALYVAKQQGRNRVVLDAAQEESPSRERSVARRATPYDKAALIRKHLVEAALAGSGRGASSGSGTQGQDGVEAAEGQRVREGDGWVGGPWMVQNDVEVEAGVGGLGGSGGGELAVVKS